MTASRIPSPAGWAGSELLALVEEVARRLPQVPRLAILDAIESEWDRLGATAGSLALPFVAPAAAWRLQRLARDPLAA